MIHSVKTNLLWLLILTISSLPLTASEYTPAYIDQYKTIVINEMQRSGIPASIKMAQAILESGSGRSTLARQSNNHFGIKCGKNWPGETVYREDDDYKNGLLIRSCFRAYDDPWDSFIAHTDFLQNNRRYNFLFELDPYDYKAWAKGLRKAGYATDPNYPKKLINLIEKYELYNLDLGISIDTEDHLLADAGATTPKSNNKKRGNTAAEPIIITVNKSTSISATYALEDGYYTFKSGDKMTDLAAHFKMPVKELYFRNRLAYGATPKAGEQLAIRSYIHFGDIPDSQKATEMDVSQDYLFEETVIISSL